MLVGCHYLHQIIFKPYYGSWHEVVMHYKKYKIQKELYYVVCT